MKVENAEKRVRLGWRGLGKEEDHPGKDWASWEDWMQDQAVGFGGLAGSQGGDPTR